MKKISLIFYISGTVLATLPLIIYKFVKFQSIIFYNLINILYIKFNFMTILISFFSIIFVIFFDIFFLKNKDQLKKNIIIIEQIFGGEINIKLNFILSILSGYFEEILFRGYLYLSLIRIFKINDINNFHTELILILFISLLFALFHINQGKTTFIISFLISVIFFVTIKLSLSIWYAILTHSIINFIEFTFIIPYQKKKYLI